MKLLTSISGVILIYVGLLLLTDRFTELANLFQSMGLGWDIESASSKFYSELRSGLWDQ